MKLIRFESKLDMDSCERFLSSRVIAPKELGINWLTAKDHKMFLYYEDGTTQSRSNEYQWGKSYFYGRIKSKKGKTIIRGSIFSVPFSTIFSVIWVVLLIYQREFVSATVITSYQLFWHIHERKNRNRIAEYLLRVFESADEV